jgi:hypothetical protein
VKYTYAYLIYFICAFSLWGRPSVRIGVLTPRTNVSDGQFADSAAKIIQEIFHEKENCDVFLERRMTMEYAAIDGDFPRHCRDPRCASALGHMFQLTRVIYGHVGKNNDRYTAQLISVDVTQERISAECSIEGTEDMSLKQVLQDAVEILTTPAAEDRETSSHRYYGEAVDNRRAMIISSSAYTAGGILWGVLGNTRYGDRLFDTEERENLSGINALAKDIPTSARAKALGNSYVAASKDADGAFFNPAGISWIDGPQVSLAYQSRFGAVNNISAAFVNKATREIGWGHTLQYTGAEASYLQEMYFGTIFSYRFNELFDRLRPVSLGAKLNMASIKTTGGTGDNAVEGSGFGIGLDVGGMAELSDRIDFGFVFYNLPYFTNYNRETATTSGVTYWEAQAPVFRLGGTFDVRYGTFFIAEGQIPLYADQPWRMAGGVEQRIFQYVLARLGAYKDILESRESPWHWTMGLGVDIPLRERSIKGGVSYEINTSGKLRDVWDFSMHFEL